MAIMCWEDDGHQLVNLPHIKQYVSFVLQNLLLDVNCLRTANHIGSVLPPVYIGTERWVSMGSRVIRAVICLEIAKRSRPMLLHKRRVTEGMRCGRKAP